MDVIRENKDVFAYLSNLVLTKPQYLDYYRIFYPRDKKSVYKFFKDNTDVQKARHSNILYNTVKDSDDFQLDEFALIMVNAIPHYNGFDAADGFMDFFLEHLSDLKIDQINKVMEVYYKNNQCLNRGRHSADTSAVTKFIETLTTVDATAGGEQ